MRLPKSVKFSSLKIKRIILKAFTVLFGNAAPSGLCRSLMRRKLYGLSQVRYCRWLWLLSGGPKPQRHQTWFIEDADQVLI